MPVMANNVRNEYRRSYTAFRNNHGSSSTTYSFNVLAMQRELYSVSTTSGKPLKPLKPNFQRFAVLRWTSHAQKEFSVSTSGNTIDYVTVSTGNPHANAGIKVYGRLLDADWNARVGRAWEKTWDKIRSGPDLSVDFLERRQTLQLLRKYLNFKAFATAFVSAAVKTKGYRKIPKSSHKRKLELDRQWRRMASAWNNNHPVEKQMIRDKAKRAPRGHKGQRALDWATNQYLEYRYGWRPFAYSIYDTASAIKNERLVSWTAITTRSGANKERTEVGGSYSSFSNPGWRREVKGSYRIRLDTYWSLPTGYSFTDFASLNPASWLWETLTLSFVVDWFVNIGQCLQNWENYYIYRNRFMGGSMTYSTKEERSYFHAAYFAPDFSYFPNGSFTTRTWYNGKICKENATYTYKERTVLNTVPTPFGPRVKVNLNSDRLLDAASLLWGFVRRTK